MKMQAHNDYLTAKLAHYNAWLLDPKRPFGVAYAGFPEEIQPAKTKRVVAVAPKATKKVKVSTTVLRAPKTGTKLEQAKVLFSNTPGFSRSQIIELFMERLGMSKAGATTYYYSAQK